MFEFISDFKKAYELREEILWMIQDVHDLKSARHQLNAWIRKVEDSKILEYKTAVRAYQNWKEPILNAFAYPYSNGITEGFNNKIKNH